VGLFIVCQSLNQDLYFLREVDSQKVIRQIFVVPEASNNVLIDHHGSDLLWVTNNTSHFSQRKELFHLVFLQPSEVALLLDVVETDGSWKAALTTSLHAKLALKAVCCEGDFFQYLPTLVRID
jgi:hypothetical protein